MVIPACYIRHKTKSCPLHPFMLYNAPTKALMYIRELYRTPYRSLRPFFIYPQ